VLGNQDSESLLQDQRVQAALAPYRDTTVYKAQALHFASRSYVAVVAIEIFEAVILSQTEVPTF
jgi:hypothetical protein